MTNLKTKNTNLSWFDKLENNVDTTWDAYQLNKNSKKHRIAYETALDALREAQNEDEEADYYDLT